MALRGLNGQPGEPGGGIRSDGKLELIDSTVRGNHAGRGGVGGAGGGSYSLPNRTLTLTRTRVVDNRAGTYGASGPANSGAKPRHPPVTVGIAASSGITTLTDSVVEANRARTTRRRRPRAASSRA